ncbi:beta-propeller fold lactonase family protein [Reyranella sp. CPCC 100927]|uniref:lactonase family protein n=1 Tax=Reyranella sp. CPCC 100927 TaxID=2599616 RepID=UPI0011B621E5|nr:beta-propeller fold lactonase family protein [Reyranella sp. CPCC 100927]TWT13528.1 beta-propeller fold lactonase family protein [Reyranella sp. CPCC 100927]
MSGTFGLIAALPAMALVAAALAVPSARAATVVYVGNAESNEIYVLQLDPANGALSLIDKVALPGIAKSGPTSPMAVSPDRRFLYVGVRSEPFTVVGFAIDPASGKLTHTANGPLADSMAYIATDRSGRFLLSASYGGNKITVNPIGPQGTVQPPSQIVATEPNAHAILADPANRHVLSTSLGGDRVHQFRFDAGTGALTPNTPPSVGVKAKAGPRHFVFHPQGTFVYLLNELDASVDVFAYDAASGQLKGLQTVSALPPGFNDKPWAADIHVTPDGRFLYASERTSSTLAAFKIEPTGGTLSLVGHTPTEKQPRGFAIDPSGRYLLAVGQLSHALSSYRIDADTGRLTRLAAYPMGQNPNWIEIVTLP